MALNESVPMPSPTFSVILPTYNRAHLLSRAIHSVLAQTFQDFELLIVDDASPDNTQEVVQAFEDERISYIRREQNGGASATRNTGIKHAKGIYISFLDDDDEYLPDCLKLIYQCFKTASDKTGFIGCGIQVIEDHTGEETYLRDQIPPTPQFENLNEIYLSCLEYLPFGSSWGMTVRSICFDVVGLFDENLRCDVDRDLIIRLVQHYYYDVIPVALVKRHWHLGPKVTAYNIVKAEAHEFLIQKNIHALSEYPHLWAEWHYKTGWLYYHSDNRMQGREFMLRGLRKYPWHMKSWIGLLLYESFGARGPQVHQFVSGIIKRASLSFKSKIMEDRELR